MDFLLQLKLALRKLIHKPSFTLPVLLILSLSLGANATILGALRSVLFRHLPYLSPDQLVAVWQVNQGGTRIQLSGPDFCDWKLRNTTFSHLAAFSIEAVNLSTAHTSRHLEMAEVSRDFFPMLGVRPLHGRWPAPEEQALGAAPVVVVSYRL